jgi:hypothetical protein
MSSNQRLSEHAITRALRMARKKGLTVQLNVFELGWSVSLPNGNCYHANTDTDMVSYVVGY